MATRCSSADRGGGECAGFGRGIPRHTDPGSVCFPCAGTTDSGYPVGGLGCRRTGHTGWALLLPAGYPSSWPDRRQSRHGGHGNRHIHNRHGCLLRAPHHGYRAAPGSHQRIGFVRCRVPCHRMEASHHRAWFRGERRQHRSHPADGPAGAHRAGNARRRVPSTVRLDRLTRTIMLPVTSELWAGRPNQGRGQ